jgi:YD repeat-containing protein
MHNSIFDIYSAFNSNGREISHTLPTGAIVKTEYTPLDQVASRETVGFRNESQVWKGSLLVEKHSPRGLVTKYTYNPLRELTLRMSNLFAYFL